MEGGGNLITLTQEVIKHRNRAQDSRRQDDKSPYKRHRCYYLRNQFFIYFVLFRNEITFSLLFQVDLILTFSVSVDIISGKSNIIQSYGLSESF